MKRILWIAAPILILLIIAWINLPTFLIPKIEQAVAKNCKDCSIKIGSIRLLPAHNLTAHFNDIIFEYNPNDKVRAVIESIHINVPWWSVLSDDRLINFLEFINPEVSYSDGDQKSVSKLVKPNLPYFKIDKTVIQNGRFKYSRHTQGTHSYFNIHNINARLSAVGNTPDLLKQPTQLLADGQVEKSGETHLSVTTFLWEDRTHIDCELKVLNQDLSDLNYFLKENAGVTLSGMMLQGQSFMEMRGDSLITKLAATYDHFDIQFDPMYDRNDFTTFFMNLGAEIMVRRKNTAKSDPKKESVQLVREPNEPIVGFMLRGLKKAAIELSLAQPF